MKYSIPKSLMKSLLDGSWHNVPPDVLRRCLGDELDDLQLYENTSIMHMVHVNLDEAGYVDDPEFCMTRKDDPAIDDPRLVFPRALFIGGSKIPGDDVFVAIQQESHDDHDPSVWVLDWHKDIPYRWTERGRLSGLISGLRRECEKGRKV